MIQATPTSTVYDAIVVGARIAGASTASALARQGLSVLAVDRSLEGSDTLSTLALMRPAVLQLNRWGLGEHLVLLGAPPIVHTVFHYAEDRVDVPIKPRLGVDALYAPRRTHLDSMLVEAARRDGAEVIHRTSVVALLHKGGRVAGAVIHGADGRPREIRANVVIGADGVHSRVASLTNAPVLRRGAHATAALYGFLGGFDRHSYHWYYRPGVSAGVIPTNDGLACVFVSTPPSRMQQELGAGSECAYRRLLGECSSNLGAHAAAARIQGLRGFLGVRGYMRKPYGPGWALVGDAGYFRDPLTAHGMSDALRDAELLARAIGRGTESALEEYAATRDSLSADFFEATESIASFDWDTTTVRPMHRALSEAMSRETEHLASLSPGLLAACQGSVKTSDTATSGDGICDYRQVPAWDTRMPS